MSPTFLCPLFTVNNTALVYLIKGAWTTKKRVCKIHLGKLFTLMQEREEEQRQECKRLKMCQRAVRM